MKSLKFLLVYSYSIILIYLVFFARRRRHVDKRILNVVPLKNIVTGYVALNTGKAGDIFNFYSNIFGNIILFIPFTFILNSFLKITPGKTVFLAFFFSLFIEITQYILKIGVADVDDILLNTLGAFIGVKIYRLWISKIKVT